MLNIKELQLYLLSNYPFHYALLQQCRIVMDEKAKYIAAVKIQTNIEITVNPALLSTFPVPEQAGILIHELQHVFSDHIKQTQSKQIESISDKLGIQPSYEMANIAMDLAINCRNSELYNSKVFGPKSKASNTLRGVFPEQFKFENGDSWPNYYAQLKGEAERKNQIKPHQDHDYFQESTKDESMMGEIVSQAAKKAKSMAGTAPREIDQFLLDYEASQQIPWYIVLRQFMQSLVDIKTKNTWKKVNRRFRGKLPGAKKLPKLDLLIGIDSSGSVSDQDLKSFFAEVDSINNTGMCSIEIAVFDTDIIQREEYVKGFEAKRQAAGGTSFIPVHELAIEERFKGVIYLTDGFAEFPKTDEVGYKCLWVLNSDVKPPYGRTIRIK